MNISRFKSDLLLYGKSVSWFTYLPSIIYRSDTNWLYTVDRISGQPVNDLKTGLVSFA